MYKYYNTNQYPYYNKTPMANSNMMRNYYRPYSYPYYGTPRYSTNQQWSRQSFNLKDYGPNPFVIDIEQVTKQNQNFRTALWTGNHLQLTLMNIEVGGEIGLESHPNLDQFIRIEEGQGVVQMGDSRDNLNFQQNVFDDYAFIIPAGKWHNLVNTGNKPIKLYSIYAPVQHPYGTIHQTKADSDAAEY